MRRRRKRTVFDVENEKIKPRKNSSRLRNARHPRLKNLPRRIFYVTHAGGYERTWKEMRATRLQVITTYLRSHVCTRVLLDRNRSERDRDAEMTRYIDVT